MRKVGQEKPTDVVKRHPNPTNWLRDKVVIPTIIKVRIVSIWGLY